MPHSIEEVLKRAVEFHSKGEVDAAKPLYSFVLQQDPEQTDAHHLLGLLAHQEGRSEEALAHISKAVELAPDYPQYRVNLGVVLQDIGKQDEAIAELRQALALDPRLAETHYNLGNALLKRGDEDEALACFQQAVSLRSDYSEALSNLGLILRGRDKPELSLAYLEKAVNVAAPFPSAFSNLCAAYTEVGRYREAVVAGRRATELLPQDASAHYNLGNGLIGMEDPVAAAASYRTAVELKPEYADAWCNLGVSLVDQTEPEEAVAAFDRALALDSGLADAHWNRALALLMMGRFREGWQAYEWRWEAVPWLDRRTFEVPQWRGEALEGQTVLVHTEQGYGDTLLFIRYVPEIRRKGRRVRVACQPALKRLLATFPGIESVSEYGEAPGAFDLHLPIMSLPGAIGVEWPNCFADAIPYISAPPCAQLEVTSETRPRIGIVWRASRINARGLFRSCRLDDLEPILSSACCRFYSFQMDAEDHERRTLDRLGVIDLSEKIGDFADTAAATAYMDLVITVDTAQAHVAGALGISVWTLLVRAADWRWFLDPVLTPWSPKMRLFRQNDYGDWRKPIGDVANALPSFIGGDYPR